MNVQAVHICRSAAATSGPLCFCRRGRTSGTTVTTDRWF